MKGGSIETRPSTPAPLHDCAHLNFHIACPLTTPFTQKACASQPSTVPYTAKHIAASASLSTPPPFPLILHRSQFQTLKLPYAGLHTIIHCSTFFLRHVLCDNPACASQTPPLSPINNAVKVPPFTKRYICPSSEGAVDYLIAVRVFWCW